jgi:lipopolysaccharide export system permease protein
MSSPLSALSFASVALLSVLTGTFRRHGGFIRPLVAVGCVVTLLALGLAINNLATRNSALIPLMWVQAVLPGAVSLWFLLVPDWISFGFRRSRASG